MNSHDTAVKLHCLTFFGRYPFSLLTHVLSDGFHVYELLKTTKDIVTDLQDKVLDEVLPTHQKSIIQFYLRQIQSFNDVMADLGLFGLMQDILDMYQVVPRSKKGSKPKVQPKSRTKAKQPEPQVDEGPEIVHLDPNKKYNFRAEFTNGYIDPFSGTAPGPDNKNEKKEDQKGSGGDDQFVIYFDMKTGTIGKIPRNECASKALIVSQNDDGEEVMQGEIEDNDEREKLIWDMKKAMKNKKGGGGTTKSPGPDRKKYVFGTGKDTTRRNTGPTKNSEDTFNKMQVLSLDAEKDKAGPFKRSSAATKGPSTSQPPKRHSLQKREPSKDAPTRSSSGQKSSTSKRLLGQKVVKESKPSNDGWSNASTMATGRSSK